MMKAFISYSHKDEGALDRLHVHLAMLKREGKLTEWFDRMFLAGDVIDAEVKKELEKSDLFLALLSPDFIASDYCYEQEMTRAIERHEQGAMRVVPIILEPCEWRSTPLEKFKALPKDGTPVSEWTNQNNAFLDIVTELRKVIEDAASTVRTKSKKATTENKDLQRTPRYRLKVDYDEVDRINYRLNAYKIIRTYFEKSISEIATVDGIKSHFEDIDQNAFTCTLVNRAKMNGTANITVRMRQGQMGLDDIYYSFSSHAPANTASGGYNIGHDDYDLFLRRGAFSIDQTGREKLSPELAAQDLWIQFIQNAGIGYD